MKTILALALSCLAACGGNNIEHRKDVMIDPLMCVSPAGSTEVKCTGGK